MGVSASSEVPPPDEDGFETVRTPSSSGSVATIVPDIEINGIPIKMDIKELDNQGTQVLTAFPPTLAPNIHPRASQTLAILFSESLTTDSHNRLRLPLERLEL
jgi:hypothetical protein